MSRNGVQSVTSLLPALLPCKPGLEDGFYVSHRVRILACDEIIERYKRWMKSPHSKEESRIDWETLGGLKLLKQATEIKDQTAARKALLMLTRYLRPKVAGDPDPDGLLNTISSAVTVDAAIGDTFFLQQFVADSIRSCEPCLWTPGKGYGLGGHSLPSNPPRMGMFCPNYQGAAVYCMFFNGLRVCLHCQSLFSTERSNKDCCSPECRDAHRVARWRDRKKTEAEQRAQKKRRAHR